MGCYLDYPIGDYPGHHCPLRPRCCRAPPISKRNKCRVRPGTCETGAAVGSRNFLPRSGRKPLHRSRHFRKENEGLRHLVFFYLHGYFIVFQVTSIRTHKLQQNSSDQLYQVPLLCCPASRTCGCFEGGKHHIQLFRGAFAEMLRHR